ncbi:MAG TPA: TonB-dependent receptor plug domain-containing protein, partial [Magnetospirillaceae bacterium]|nr:TonB-dependent receptor plug domain-containing protein [Magnetospirillaceae bacterium]
MLLAIGAVCLWAAPARAADGETRRIHVDVSGGPAPEVLNAIASQAGWQLLYPYDLVAGRRLPPVKGDYTLAEILDHIGLSLELRAETGDGVVIRLVALSKSSASPELTPEIKAALSGEEIAEIIIGGFRHSIEAALDKKRTAPAEIDAINSEDIGRFPDKNVADSLQRLPGISVDRFWGEGRDIYIRGTDNTLNRTQMNGQNVASAYWWANDNPSRGFNYDILASELVRSVEVYKSPTADLDEGSIGGLVIVRTRRPLDMPKDWTLEASAEGVYSELPAQADPNASLLLSWQNENRTFGLLGSLIYQERHIRRDGLESFADSELYSLKDQNGRTYNGVYVPFEGGSAMFRQDKKRWTENLTLQAKPTPDWDLAINLVNATEQEDNNNQNYLWLGGAALAPNVAGASNLVTDPRFITTSDGHLALVGGIVGLPSEVHAAYEPIFRDAYVNSHVV